MHGISLNCNTDLSWFNNIDACGLVDKKATSLSHRLNRDVTVAETLPVFLSAFSAIFNSHLKRDSPYLKQLIQ